tara:strand:+ start:288 stop:1631 length:1344 start_codon:yes stop_codon:yes gene_type:complete
MADKAGLYGGTGTAFPSEVDGGKKLYWEINSENGEANLYERRGALSSILIGTKSPGKKFKVNDPPFPKKGFFEVFNEEQRKKFLSDENQKKLNAQAAQAAKNGCIAIKGNTKEACAKRTEELLKTGKATTDQKATADEVAGANAEELSEALSKIKDIEGTDKGISKELRYPLDMAKNQDVIKFSMVKYKASGLSTGGSRFGAAERDRIKPNAKIGSGDRQIIATAILPVPGQIQDTNSATWSDDSANAGQLALAALGKSAANGEDVTAKFTEMSNTVSGNSDVMKKAITGTLIGGATGVNILGRQGGLIINPNLELLFSKPALREFTLNFRLSARSKKEGLEVIKIIRFFKQGMAPIREASNLFLKAPNTFQVHYLLRGKNSEEHPFIGRMKECALTSVNTNYTPENNYATYEDGLMVSYQITLTLKELDPVYNDDYKEIPDTEIGF